MKQINLEETGRRIQAKRKALGLTMQDVINRLYLGSPMSVWKWENGMNLPTLDNLVNLADILGCEPMDLIVVTEGRND